MPNNCLKIVPLSGKLIRNLILFFDEIKDNPFFHPHLFTKQQAEKLCRYKGKDLYYALENGSVIGYGFIRGWDANWDEKCVGLIIKKSMQGRKLGKLFLDFLHASAALRGLKKVRLHVNPSNTSALRLYQKEGYVFNGELKGREMVGRKCL